ncbi:MAG: hypothetical protein BGN97_11045 [Microbacterium sp. 69-10]|uniref:amidohydrolase n=1 Tax=Microbacterium sp. 69-10 TaxID=1895783 RepID=UPI00095E3E52|nr:amidohydrolase [Microbacterium sp. 69-10]OJU40379.1 MAG: hypothetical protein BGN97_11045 [Microbacterium sp. 69-10]
MPSPELTERIEQALADLRADARQVSDSIHARPELRFEERFAAAILSDRLEQAGFRLERGIAGMPTAFRASIGEGRPTLAILCEYDALPEIGHGCGHNLIAAGGMLAGLALARAFRGAGTIQVVGTPAEEGGGGKIVELEAGVFDEVDAALMFHPSDHTRMIRHATASRKVKVSFHGIAAHAAASPEHGRSALAAVIQLFVAVDALRQFVPETARIHGVITDGGQAANVVPAFAAAEFQLRDVTSTGVEHLLERFRAAVEASALATGTDGELTLGSLYTERKNNRPLAERIGAYLSAQGMPPEPPLLTGGTGSSDIGNVSLAIPAVHPYVQVMPRGTATHTAEMTEYAATDEAFEATVAAARALALTGGDFLEDGVFRDEVAADFRDRGPDVPMGAR